jgi:hypothetical protein
MTRFLAQDLKAYQNEYSRGACEADDNEPEFESIARHGRIQISRC